LEAIAARVDAQGLDPQPRSGRQERFEALVGSYLR
jgi:xylose isomerase